MKRIATIDIGSNTLLLLCAEKSGAEIRRKFDLCRFGRLGQGLDKTGRLADAAIARCLDILKEYRARMDEFAPAAVGCVATEAVRKAKNQSQFIAPAEEILGVKIEVIDGVREADLSCRAVLESLPATRHGTSVIVDVGGASTEVIVTQDGRRTHATSIAIGAVRLTERHLSSDPPLASEIRALEDDIDGAFSALELPPINTLIAAAGTATTLAALEKKLDPYDPDVVHGLEMSASAVTNWTERLFSLSIADRKRLPGLDAGRADVIAAGAAIISRLLHHTRLASLLISDRGVRYGLAHEL